MAKKPDLENMVMILNQYLAEIEDDKTEVEEDKEKEEEEGGDTEELEKFIDQLDNKIGYLTEAIEAIEALI